MWMGVGSYWGLGVVIRNQFGNVVAARTKKLRAAHGPDYAEARAIMLGLQVALKCGYFSVRLKSDCLGVVQSILQKRSNSSYFGVLLKQIINLGSQFGVFNICHIGRNANRVAH
ncbi:uncharacterized protein LOC130735137 [Lotus japonicus]|uniref:uncharacterized protein LOC130735137 n=1 Tax=Lotus japonicus TaxID=34305 RepID=UPI00258FFDF4|nr:uncharacterized protein LOC130735137 [Lotus japonicus]